MNVELYSHHYDRINVNDDGVQGTGVVQFCARIDGRKLADITIELDEAGKRQLIEVVRQWDRDDEARARQIAAEDEWEALPIEQRRVIPHPYGVYWPQVVDGSETSDHGRDDDPVSMLDGIDTIL